MFELSMYGKCTVAELVYPNPLLLHLTSAEGGWHVICVLVYLLIFYSCKIGILQADSAIKLVLSCV